MSSDRLEVTCSFENMSLELSEIKAALVLGDISLASTKYSEFKSKMQNLKKSFKGKALNRYQEYFLLPAVSEILSSSLSTRKNSRSKTDIALSVADADDYISYWISELKCVVEDDFVSGFQCV